MSMEIIDSQKILNQITSNLRLKQKTVGFVPTMGALHQGHAELIRRSVRENDYTVCSIFVNPTQFNNSSDLEHYPRTPQKDIDLLNECKCNYLFMPSVEEMYPSNQDSKITIDLGGLDLVMEGAHRPGHFAGVVQIVSKLFSAVGPCNAYFGEKDFQQLAIVRRMVEKLKLPVNILGCPIVREADGLAMSSRNMRLSNEERKVAPFIYQTLLKAKKMWGSSSPNEIKSFVTTEFSKNKIFSLEYFEISDINTLQPVSANSHDTAVGCIAVHLGAVRLIDNVIFSIQ
jgi:pantoate--beta-alanine ligase